MKDNIKQIFICIILTLLAVFGGMALSIESPVSKTEAYVLILVCLFNSIWFLPYFIYYHKNGKPIQANRTALIYLLSVIPFIILPLRQPKFESEIWKKSIDNTRFYGNTPAYARGEMVEDAVESGILINKTLAQIEDMLGPNHFTEKTSKNPHVIWYYYSNNNPFEGCDKIYIVFEKENSIDAGIGGCD